jgi:hypothetical protein
VGKKTTCIGVIVLRVIKMWLYAYLYVLIDIIFESKKKQSRLNQTILSNRKFYNIRYCLRLRVINLYSYRRFSILHYWKNRKCSKSEHRCVGGVEGGFYFNGFFMNEYSITMEKLCKFMYRKKKVTKTKT